jgi:putative NIF3 family GTP cyclohydrolase 1 type 2
VSVGVQVGELQHYLDGLLAVGDFEDYGPNGLQVEGRATVRKIVSGVTASRALIDAAVEAGADAVLVHHGLFWRGQDGRLTGWLAERVRRLMAHGVNLSQAHLARETGVAFLACGHHATERYGAPALGAHLAERYALEHRYVDIDNPA